MNFKSVDGLLREARRQKHVPDGNVPVICLLDPDGDLSRDFAHVTNQMATVENDFEKGEANGNRALIYLVERVMWDWRKRTKERHDEQPPGD